MDTVARLAPSARSELFSQAAVRMRLLPGLVEKDFWVCWTLKHLFDIPEVGRHLMFKDRGQGRYTLRYRFETTFAPVSRMRLKIEINTREHFSVLGIEPLIPADSDYDPAVAAQLVGSELIAKLPGEAWKGRGP